MSLRGWPSLEIEGGVRGQTWVVAATLFALLFAPFVAALSPRVAVFAAVLTTTFAVVSFRRVGWFGGARTVQRARWIEQDVWRLLERDGIDRAATLSPDSRIMGRLVWLRFRTDDGERHLFFWGDDLAPNLRRQLVARLQLIAASETHARRDGDPPVPR